MIDATIVRAHQHSAGGQKTRRASHRPIPRRTDHVRFTRSSTPLAILRGDAQGPGSRSDLRSTAHRSRRSRRFDRRQGVRRRRLHRRPQRSSDRPGHPIQIQPKNPAPVRLRPLLRTQSLRAFFNKLKHSRAIARYDVRFSSPPSTSLRHPPQLKTGPNFRTGPLQGPDEVLARTRGLLPQPERGSRAQNQPAAIVREHEGGYQEMKSPTSDGAGQFSFANVHFSGVARSCARMLSFQWVARQVFRVSGRMV